MNKKLAFGLCTLGLMATAFSAQAEAFMRNSHSKFAVFKTDTSPHLILVGNDDEGGDNNSTDDEGGSNNSTDSDGGSNG
jgi:hypothetical protein